MSEASESNFDIEPGHFRIFQITKTRKRILQKVAWTATGAFSKHSEGRSDDAPFDQLHANLRICNNEQAKPQLRHTSLLHAAPQIIGLTSHTRTNLSNSASSAAGIYPASFPACNARDKSTRKRLHEQPATGQQAREAQQGCREHSRRAPRRGGAGPSRSRRSRPRQAGRCARASAPPLAGSRSGSS